jgi:hypothetical protein
VAARAELVEAARCALWIDEVVSMPDEAAWALAGEPRGDDALMLELLAPYEGHRRRVLLLIKNAGASAPKYGPRSAITALEGI